jgi:hypothetical protein
MSQTSIAKILNSLMLTYSMYIEHIPSHKMLEEFRQAINEEEETHLTVAQMHELWEDRSVGVGRAKRETGITKEGKALANARKRGIVHIDIKSYTICLMTCLKGDMGFQGMCREMIRMRRAKLVGFVRDAFVLTFRPPSIEHGEEDDPSLPEKVARYNAAVRTPIASVETSSGDGDLLVYGRNMQATPHAQRVAIDGQSTDWTNCQLYLQFLSAVQLRIPAMPLEFHDTFIPPLQVSSTSRHVEAWIQMTVSIILTNCAVFSELTFAI